VPEHVAGSPVFKATVAVIVSEPGKVVGSTIPEIVVVVTQRTSIIALAETATVTAASFDALLDIVPVELSAP
jgi:hypothetical protein